MIYSKYNSFLFIHVWKAAGTSIRKSLFKYQWHPILRPIMPYAYDRIKTRLLRTINNDQPIKIFSHTLLSAHLSAQEAKLILGEEEFAKVFKFAFVRNPFDLQVSLFHYIKQSSKHRWHNEVKDLNNFEEFIDWREKKNNWELQFNMLSDKKDQLLVDFIGKVETISEDLSYLSKKLNLDLALHSENRSKREKTYKDYYNDKLVNIVSERLKKDIENFKYEF